MIVSNRGKRTNRFRSYWCCYHEKCVPQFTCSPVRIVEGPPAEVGVVEFDAQGAGEYSDGSRAVGAHGETMVIAAATTEGRSSGDMLR